MKYPGSGLVCPESKHFIDTIRMNTYRAERAMGGEVRESLAPEADARPDAGVAKLSAAFTKSGTSHPGANLRFIDRQDGVFRLLPVTFSRS